jgi:hypothetical protein
MIPLKTNTSIFVQQKNSFFGLLILLVVLNINSVVAQIQNNGLLHLSDNASFYVGSGSFTFGTGSITTTTRTPNTYGKLALASGVTVSGAASGASLFTDGFVSTKSGSYFELPTGQTTTYAPIGVTNAAVTNGVEAAYYVAAPSSVGANTESTITSLPSAGYWEVKGDNATLTMIWSASISSLTNSINDLTVAGFNTSTNKWEAITSGTPTGSLTSGTIATAAAVTLANYSAFTLAKRGITCAELVAASGNTSTWNGTSWDTPPTLSDSAVLTGNYPGGSFVCNSLAIGTNSITLIDGQTIEVVNGITGSGTITMSNTASILQRNDASTISPTINLTKKTRLGMYANDYIYWGSPLVSTSLSVLNTAQVPTYSAGAFDSKYKYVSGDATTTGGWQTLDAISPGKGFIMRIKQQAPFSTTGTQVNSQIDLTFSGAANNGTVSVPVANITASPTSARNNNLLANPYPSAIDADKFLEYNTNLDGVVYIWKAQTSNTGLVGVAYNKSDYIAFTRAGSTVESGIGSTVFNGKIATGQGFKVKAITSSGSGTAIFNNCMRVSGSNDQFFKNNGIVDRYKLNLAGANGDGNQILVAYMQETSLGYDRMYDAELNSVSAAQLFSTIQDDDRKLAINARPAFEVNDEVNLGVRKSDTSSEVFSIAITDKEGVFSGNEVNVYLVDNLLDVHHNLENGAYTFSSNTTEINNRFKVIYQTNALNTTVYDSNTVYATITNQQLKITSSLPMTNVAVYDISGRLITDFKVNSEKNATSNFLFADGIYIAKIKLNNGTIATQKLVNKK